MTRFLEDGVAGATSVHLGTHIRSWGMNGDVSKAYDDIEVGEYAG